MLPIVIASGNAHKVQEFRALLDPTWEIQSLRDHPTLPSPEEDGQTFMENATIKALSASRRLGDAFLVLADDSGLEVDALGGAPGVRSARYAGLRATDAENRTKLLAELLRLGVCGSERTARFRCALVLAQGERLSHLGIGSVEGVLADEEIGVGGFGYDSLFIPEGYAQTFGLLPAEVKHRFSHRARAVAELRAHF